MVLSLPMPEPPSNGQKTMIRKRKNKASGKGGGSSSFLSGLASPKLTGSLAEALEKQANNQAQQAAAKSGLVSTDPFTALQNQIMSQYQSINVPSTPYDQLKQMAQEQVGAQFDPVIHALMDQMAQTGNRATRNAGEARKMYNSLGSDFLSQLPELTNQFAQQDKETNARYDSAQQQLKQQYQGQQDQQNAILQQLGIQAAAPDASKQAADDQSYFQGSMEADQQSALNALKQQQLAQSNYTQNLGDTTKVAGENQAQDIMQQFRDYMGQANSQLTGLQQQRGSALASLLQQMQAQDAQRVQSEEQKQFQNLMSLANFQLSAAKAAQSAAGNSNDLFKGTTGLSGAQNFLAQQYPNSPIIASHLMGDINNVLSNPDVVNGKYQLTPADPSTGKSATYSDVGQEYMIDLLRQQIEKENQSVPGRYGNADINNAINALLAYMGKLR